MSEHMYSQAWRRFATWMALPALDSKVWWAMAFFLGFTLAQVKPLTWEPECRAVDLPYQKVLVRLRARQVPKQKGKMYHLVRRQSNSTCRLSQKEIRMIRVREGTYATTSAADAAVLMRHLRKRNKSDWRSESTANLLELCGNMGKVSYGGF